MVRKFSSIKTKINYFITKRTPSIFYPILLKLIYFKTKKQKLNLKNPKKLSEKIQWLKLYDNNKRKEELSDKIRVKEYIKQKCPELKIAQTIQIANDFEEIDFSTLPESFVIKTNNSCKTNFFIKNKARLKPSFKKLLSKYFKQALEYNYAFFSIELQYKNIKPQIFIEEYLPPVKIDTPYAYEVWCFNEKPEFIVVLTKKSPKNWPNLFTGKIYDFSWNLLNFEIHMPTNNEQIKRIKDLDKIYQYCKILSKGFKFVRIDFIISNNEIYFGEMTFTPSSGYFFLNPETIDIELGNKLKLY